MMEAALVRVRQLPAVQQRRAAAVIGAIVADAAGELRPQVYVTRVSTSPAHLSVCVVTPLHWIYDQSKVAELVAAGTAEFSPTSHCPFYTVPAGEVSMQL